MDVALQILGGIFLVIVVVTAAIFLFVRSKWKKIQELAEMVDGMPMPSMTATVREVGEDVWHDPDKVAVLIRQFKELGFEPGGIYAVEEIPNCRMQALGLDDVIAVVYEHDFAGIFADVCGNLVDGPELTFTSAPAGSELDNHPDMEKHWMEGAPPGELFDALRARTAGAGIKPFPLDQFPVHFENTWAKEMKWRMERGGVNEEETRRIAGNMDIDLGEELIGMSHSDTKTQEIERLAEGCLEQFERTTELSITEWKKFDGFFVFRDDLHAEGFVDYLEGHLLFEDEHRQAFLKTSETASLGKALEELLPHAEETVTSLGRVAEPMAVEVFGYVEQY